MIYFILILLVFISCYYALYTIRRRLNIECTNSLNKIRQFISFRINYKEGTDAIVSLEWINDTSWRTNSTDAYYAEHGYPLSDIFIDDIREYSPIVNSVNETKQIIYTDEVCIPNFLFLKLGDTAKAFIRKGNAGGNSILSEAYSIDYFEQYLDGNNFIFENDIGYWMDTVSMVDFITVVDNVRIGVSVTRALNYYEPENFDKDMARKLLRKKLHGLLVARNAVVTEQSFNCSLLHVWAQNQTVADSLHDAYREIDVNKLGPDVVGNVGVIISVCDNWTIYGNINSILAYLVKF